MVAQDSEVLPYRRCQYLRVANLQPRRDSVESDAVAGILSGRRAAPVRVRNVGSGVCGEIFALGHRCGGSDYWSTSHVVANGRHEDRKICQGSSSGDFPKGIADFAIFVDMFLRPVDSAVDIHPRVQPGLAFG